jgi:ubiquinone/menaquinone biosynthesis C-methylase UbiE
MKMSRFEKRFVNSRSHSRRVSRHAEELLLFARPQAGQNYLDVGCGNGAAAIALARKYGLSVTGVDVDPEQIRLAREAARGHSALRFFEADATSLPFAGEEFQIVASNKVTHHIANWEAAFAEMARVVAPGGYLIYGDFVLPGILASAASKVLRGAGAPTVETLRSMAQRNQLMALHHSRRILHHDLVWRKAARRIDDRTEARCQAPIASK